MDLSTIAIHFVKEFFILGGMTFAVLGLLGLIGLWPVLVLFPRSEALRWPLYAPLTGMVLLTLVGVPLVLLGFSVGSWARIVTAVGGTFGGLALKTHLFTPRGRRLLFSYIRKRSMIVVLVLLVPVVLSTYLVAGSHGGHVRDIWGSSDFGTFWAVSEYLITNGADSNSYINQNTYHNKIVEVLLGEYSRLGNVVSISFLGAILSPGNINHVIIPLLVAVIILMLGSAQHWLERENLGKHFLLLPLLCYPFLYFLLYFSYSSQATGVVLFIASVLIFEQKCLLSRGRKYTAGTIISGIFAGAALLHYPSLLVAAVLFAVMMLCFEIRGRAIHHSLLWTFFVLLICGYYLPLIVFELTQVNATIPGWDWQSLIGPFEFLGIRSVLGYDLPTPVGTGLKPVEYGVSLVLGLTLCYGVWKSHLKIASLTVVTTTGLLLTVVGIKLFQHVPHATHAFVKIVSTFAIWLLVLVLIPAGRLLLENKKVPGYALLIIAGVFISGQLASVQYGALQRPWYSDELITLSRRQIEKGYCVSFSPNLHWALSTPVVRDARRLLQEESFTSESLPVKFPLLVVKKVEQLTPFDRTQIVDKEGDYVAVLNGLTAN